MHIVPFILIILVLIIVLCIPPSAISLCTDCARWITRPARQEFDIPGEEERLLSDDEGQVASPTQDQQWGSARNHAFDHRNHDASQAKWIESAHNKIRELQGELLTCVSRNEELRQRCETLSRDLEGAQLFLNTADAFSDSEIVQLLQKLNAELQHTSTFMAESVLSVFELGALTTRPELQVVANRASEKVGATLVQFLQTKGREGFEEEVPMYLQVAFQAFLTSYLCRIVSSWTLDDKHNTFLSEMYQRMQDAEKHAISGRWRALTHAYAFPTCVGEPHSLVTPIIAGLSDILLVVGCTASQPDIMSELSSTFENKILSAVSLAGRLNQMIGGVISGDFEVFAVRPGEMFHEEVMDVDVDVDSSGGASSETGSTQTVLCTSEMGLMKRVQNGSGEETKVAIKAKVVFESFLDSAD